MAALAALDPTALTIKRICRAAQVTAPTIYYHYGNKDGLIAAAVERLVADWLAAMDAAVDRQAPLEAAIAQAITVWTQAITSPSRPLAVFTWATLLLSESADLPRGALIEARDRGRAMIADVATQYIGPGPGVDVIAQAGHGLGDRHRGAVRARPRHAGAVDAARRPQARPCGSIAAGA